MQDLFKGASYLLRGFSLIHQSGIRRFAYLPMLINIVLFSVAIWFGVSQFDGWINSLIPGWLPTWLTEALMWVLWPLFALLVTVIVFFTFSIIANLLAAPFNGILAEAVEDKLTGSPPPSQAWQQIIRDTPRMLFNELKKIAYFLMWIIPLFILSWIPVLNIVAPALWILFSAWTLTLEYHDYPLANQQMGFAAQRQLLKQKRMLSLGFGFTTLGATMIPLVNFVVIPAAVAGATALYVEQLKPLSNRQS